MITSSHSPPVESPVELEPVVCWPLIIGAVGFLALVVAGLGGFAAWSALHLSPHPVAAVDVAPPSEAAPVPEAPVDLPAAPVARRDNDRVVKVHREVIQKPYTPLPQPRVKAPDPSPPLPLTFRASPPPAGNPWPQGLRKEEVERKPLAFRPTDDLGAVRMKKLVVEPFPLTSALRDLLNGRTDPSDQTAPDRGD